MAEKTLRLSMIAACAAALSLAGCGGSGKTEAPKAAAPAPPAAEAAPPPASIPSHTTVTSEPTGAPAQAATPPKPGEHHTVATVNGKPIWEEKVFALYRMNRSMLQQRGRTLSENDERVLRAQSLQLAVADELFYQDAMKKGIKVSKGEVDEAVKQLKTRVGSEERYKQFVADSGFSDIDVRKELERQLQTEAYRKGLFAGKSVTEEQTKKFYDENVSKGMFSVPEQVHVQFIVLRVGETDPDTVKGESKKRAEEAAKRAAAGEDFSALAKQYSQDPSAERGGDIGLVPRGVMFPKFDEVAFALPPGGISPAFETPRGFGVVKVLEKKPPSTRTYEDVKDALKADMGRLLEQDAMKAKATELAQNATINVLDQSYLAPPAPPAPPASAPAEAAKKP